MSRNDFENFSTLRDIKVQAIKDIISSNKWIRIIILL